MADETTKTDETPEVDAPETDAPAAEDHPVADAVQEETTSVEPVVESDSPVTQDSNVGVATAQTFGPANPPASSAPVDEVFTQTDRTIIDHEDPLGTKYQFLGASGPQPLPLAGANGDVRTPEQKLATP